MPNIGRPKSLNKMVHTALVLPPELRDQLRSEGPLAEVIRRRLVASYEQAPPPPPRNLQDIVVLVEHEMATLTMKARGLCP